MISPLELVALTFEIIFILNVLGFPFESFDEIDGKPVHKPNEPTAEERKAQQVAALKAALAQLREMAAGQNVELDVLDQTTLAAMASSPGVAQSPFSLVS